MTIEQIKSYGITTDSWSTLDGVCKRILFTNEGFIWSSPKTIQFYFESDSGLLFIRYTKGFLTEEPGEKKIEISLKDNFGNIKKYYTPLFAGGVNDTKISWYHECFDINEITGIV